MTDRTNQHVKILGGMSEFVGRTGTILCKEDKLYRVKLDEPVEIPNVGLVADDLWEGKMLRRLRQRRHIKTVEAAKPAAPAAKPAPVVELAPAKPANFRYAGSTAERMDNALLKGGDIEVLAKEADVTKGTLRSHARFRGKNGSLWSVGRVKPLCSQTI